jgi:hypothetical protein
MPDADGYQAQSGIHSAMTRQRLQVLSHPTCSTAACDAAAAAAAVGRHVLMHVSDARCLSCMQQMHVLLLLLLLLLFCYPQPLAYEACKAYKTPAPTPAQCGTCLVCMYCCDTCLRGAKFAPFLQTWFALL